MRLFQVQAVSYSPACLYRMFSSGSGSRTRIHPLLYIPYQTPSTHVKDILYHNYKNSFLCGDTGGASTFSSEELGAKALVLSKLADTVLQMVRIEAGLDLEPELEGPQTVATVSLEAGCGEDDLPFEQRGVACFDRFSKLLKESVDKNSCKENKDGK